MSRENPHVNETVDGTLTGTKNYNVKIIVTAREAWGRNTVPDNYLPEGEELSPDVWHGRSGRGLRAPLRV